MKMKTTGMMAAVSLCAAAGVAQGQLTLKMDVNGFTYSHSEPLAMDYDGDISWSLGSGYLLETAFGHGGRTGGFTPYDTDNELASLTGDLSFEDGWVETGTFRITLVGGDYYEATVRPFSGQLEQSGSSWELTAFSWYGAFKDEFDQDSDSFGDIDVSAWSDYQGVGQHLLGEFVKLNFGADLKADIDVFVMVPLPPAAYAGLGMLAGVMGLSYVLRRR